MKMKHLTIVYLLCACIGFTACGSEDDLNPESVFVDEPELDPDDYTYAFDTWLEATYLMPYNLQFRYKMQDVGADMDFNLVPTNFEKAQEMAILVKYLWFDVYNTVVDPDFLKAYGPRIIHLIGSAASNPVQGTEILGLAEGGLKVSLFKCNNLDYTNIEQMNEYYFKTMHHEFAHILHQQRTYPKEFEIYTAGYYDPAGWQFRTDSEAASLGCASPYATSQPREDFVEIIANYIVKPDAWWDEWMKMAAKPGVNQSGETVTETVDGKAVLEAKIEMCRKWLKDSWGIDLDALRDDVQERQLHIEEVMSETYW
ncbi:putative zinc-binding metallopeptidase [Parabacteroides sp. OttesenSCG-928-N08]|nr:putative zinc-binding metallopeptidase [Parabacteroides sp. OttesenSCG-928-N08]